jgi:hypothetical protein
MQGGVAFVAECNKLGMGIHFHQPGVKPVETYHLIFHALTLRKIVIRALVSSFVAVSGCFRFPSPNPTAFRIQVLRGQHPKTKARSVGRAREPVDEPSLDPLVHGQGHDYAAEPAAEVVADYEAHLVLSWGQVEGVGVEDAFGL